MCLTSASVKRKTRDLIFSLDPGKVAKKATDFSRNRRCPLPDTILFLLSLAGHSLNTEIGDFFLLQGRIAPSASAISQQRDKLRDSALPELFDSFNHLFPFKKTFHGLHLLAADGSDTNIPALKGDKSTFVLDKTGQKGHHQMHLDALYDILEKRYVDARISPRAKFNENKALCEMVDRYTLNGPSLFIADRGYPTFNTLAHIQNAGQFFLIRAKTPFGKSSPLKGIAFPEKDEFDIEHHYILRRRRVRKTEDHSIYKNLRNDRPFDYIDINDRTTEYRIDFRIVKVKIKEDLYEYLLTNLPQETFPAGTLKELYRMRWEIETSFRRLKYNIGLNFFHSKKRSFIKQEIFVRLIMHNFISLIISCIRVPQKKRKYTYAVSFSDAVPHCRRFLYMKISSVQLKNLLLKHLTPIRPGRNAPRKVRSQRVQALNNRP